MGVVAIFPVFFIIVFIFVIGMFILSAAKGLTTWNRNNNSPLLTVPATAVSKRMQTTHHHHSRSHMDTMPASTTSYFITFQFESGDRLEMGVSSYDYAYIVEGDIGKLTFQGTRFKGFER